MGLSRVSGPDIFSDDRNKDNQFKIEGTLKESNVTKLSDHEQQRLSFGIEILKIFGMDRGSRKVTLSIASSLPSNGSALNNNAYGNSFHWNSESRILYVREERLESVGEFAMLLVHTLAHISADPKGMKLVTQSLFMSSQQVEKLRSIRPGGNNNGAPQRGNKAAEEEYYKTASLEERMSRYRAFRNRPELLQFVSTVDNDGSSSSNNSNSNNNSNDDLATRLAKQINEMEKNMNSISNEYKNQLSTNANMDGAMKQIKSRVDDLQNSMNKLKGNKKQNAEAELKHLMQQMASAQSDIDSNQGTTQSLLSKKQQLSSKLNAKKKSLEKFKSGAL